MRISYKDLKDKEQALMRLLQFPMEPKLAYRMSKIARKIQDIYKFVNETRISLVEKYGEKKEKDLMQVPDEKLPVFKKEFEDFLAKEIDLDIQPIPWECVEQSGVKLSPVDLAVLDLFIVVPDKLKN